MNDYMTTLREREIINNAHNDLWGILGLITLIITLFF